MKTSSKRQKKIHPKDRKVRLSLKRLLKYKVPLTLRGKICQTTLVEK